MSTELKTPLQQTCDPYEDLGGSSDPNLFTDLMLEEVARPSGDSPVQTALLDKDPIIELGENARQLETTLGCGGCALSGTCEAKSRLDSFIVVASKREQELLKRKTDEDVLPYVDAFSRWATNNRIKDNPGLRREEKLKPIEAMNTVQGLFIKRLLEIEEPADKDREIQLIYSHLSPGMQRKFVEEGFIDGVITETYVFEELKKLEESGIQKASDTRSERFQVELSSVEEDTQEGFDFKVIYQSLDSEGEVKFQEVVYLDAKAKLPSDARKLGTHFAEKRSTDTDSRQYKTRKNGEPVYVLAPNPSGITEHAYLRTRKLEPGGRTILSFSPRSFGREQPPFATMARLSVRGAVKESRQARRDMKKFVKV